MAKKVKITVTEGPKQVVSVLPEQVYDESPLIEPGVKIVLDSLIQSSVDKSKEEPMAQEEDTDINFFVPEDLLNGKMDSMTEKDLLLTVKNTYQYILDMTFDTRDFMYIELLMSPKFLVALNTIIMGEQLQHKTIFQLNRMAYEYLMIGNDPMKNPLVADIHKIIAKTANRNMINKLSILGLPEDLCADLALSRFSIEDECISTRRLNNIIIQQSRKIMTEQMIVNIYSTLFTSMTSLLVGTMYDVYPEEELSYSPDASVIYSTINLAVLDLLEQMPSDDIRKVLLNYANSYKLNSIEQDVRFNICCTGYPRINYVVQYLSDVEGIIFP